MATFNLNAISFVDDLDLMPGWNNISLEQLEQYLGDLMSEGIQPKDLPDVFSVVAQVKALAKLSGLTDASADPEMLSAFADAEGVAEVVYGPSIKAAEDGTLVFVAGTETVPVTIDGRKVSIGKLAGEVEFSQADSDSDRWWVSASVDFLVNRSTITLPILLLNGDEMEGVEKLHLRDAWDNGTFSQYVKKIGGAGYIKLKELPLGEYALVDVWENPTHEKFGRSWGLRLEGISSNVASAGRLEKTLAGLLPLYKKRLAAGKVQTLAISDKRNVSGGVAVSAAILDRAPNPSKLVQSVGAANAIASSEPAALKSAALALDEMPF